jgi:molecular chaperone DnaK (HSP70)
MKSRLNCNIGIEYWCTIFGELFQKNNIEDQKITIELPIKKYINVTTVVDDQSAISIKIYEGERVLSKYCQLVGDFCINDIPKRKAGQIWIGLLLEIDKDEVIYATAHVPESGERKKVIIAKGFNNYVPDKNVLLEAEINF